MGHSVGFEVIEPVRVQGVTLIAKGTPVYAEVIRAKKGRMFGKPAVLEVMMSAVKAVDCQLLSLQTALVWNANDRKEAAKVIGEVGQKAVDEVEGGRFGDLPIGAFVRGKNVILPQGTTVTVQSPRDFRIETTGS